MKKQIHSIHNKTAELYSKLSKSRRKQVGAIIVKDDRIISIGYNGTPSGFDNNCEDVLEDGSLVTKDTVLHAESNAISKVAKSSDSSEGADLYCTLSPCLECSKLIAQAGIKRVYFSEFYKKTDGIDKILKPSGIEVYYIIDDQVMSFRKYHATDLELLKKWRNTRYADFISYFLKVESLIGNDECIKFIKEEIEQYYKEERGENNV